MSQILTVKSGIIFLVKMSYASEPWHCKYHALNIKPGLSSVPYISFCGKEQTNVLVAILTDHWGACQTVLSEIKLA